MFNINHKPPSNRSSLGIYASLFILTLLVTLLLARSMVMVNVELNASAAGNMTLSWRDNSSQYSTFNSKTTAIQRGLQSHFFILWTLGDIKKLAIKPIDRQANITIKHIIIRTLGYEQLNFNTNQHFERFKSLREIADFNVVNNQLNLRTTGKNAQFEFDVIHPQINTKNTVLIDLINLKVALISIAILITLGFIYPLIHLPVLLAGVISALLYFSPFTANYAVINVTLYSAQPDQLTVYWAANQQPFSEQHVRRINTQLGSHSYKLAMSQIDSIQHIRLDPLEANGKVLIEQIEISALNHDPIILNASNQFKGIDFSKKPYLKIVNNTLEFTADNADAFFEFNIDPKNFKIKHTLELYYCLLVVLGFMTLLYYGVKLKYPTYLKTLAVINICVGILIFSIMVMQYYWRDQHDFYQDALKIKTGLLLIAIGLVIGFYYRSVQIIVLYLSLFLAVFYHTQLKSQYATIALEIQTPVNSELVVYWANKFEAYQEHKSVHINTKAGEHLYRLDIGRLNDIHSIRIDPLATSGQAKIKTILLSGLGYDPIRLNAANQFYAVDVKTNPSLKVTDDSLIFEAKNADEFFEVQLNSEAFKASIVLEFYLGFLLLLTLINIGVTLLKRITPELTPNITQISLKIGSIIVAIMLLQTIFSANYGFFMDYQANELVITTAGEKALSMGNANKTHDIAHIGLLNFAYAMVIVLALLILSIFSKMIHVIYLSAFLILCGVIGYAIKDKDTLIHIEMETSVANRLKVYWADEAELYKEQHSATVNTAIGRHIYTLSMANLNNLHNIRIEPINTEGHAAISAIEINEAGYAPIMLNAQNHFYLVDRVLKTKSTNKETTDHLTVEQDKLIFTTTGNDRFFELIVEPDAFKAPYRLRFYAQFFLLLAGIAGSLYWVNRRFGFFNSDSAIVIIRLCGVIIAVMVLQMAWLSDYDVHPDEKAHIDSIDYYTQYSDPPVLGDVRSLNTYQYPWGVSRLDDLGVSYFLMGKLKSIITYYAEDTVFTSRVFNSLLMLGLVCCTRHKQFALFLLPLFCLPQVWHLFSYANRDGFALFLAILLGWQLVNPSSNLNKYLNRQTKNMSWCNLLVPSLLLGLLSIEISNYIIFILYFVAILLWQGLFVSSQRRIFFIRCLVLMVLAGLLYGVRKSADIYLNGFDKQAQKIAYAENIAASDFKPSVAVTDKGYFGLRLQQRGVDALTLFEPRWEWQTLTFKSFVGLYGNQFAESSPDWYYSFVTYLYCLVAVICMITVVRYGHFKYWLLTGITLVFVFGDILMGFLYSWTYDFQPQGRYIFPLIPMLMVYLFNVAPLMGNKSKAMLFACGVLLFVLSLFSFRLIALTYLIS